MLWGGKGKGLRGELAFPSLPSVDYSGLYEVPMSIASSEKGYSCLSNQWEGMSDEGMANLLL